MSQYTHTTSLRTMTMDRPDEPAGEPRFELDRAGAIRAIHQQWRLDPSDEQSWWIGAFGDDLADSVETVSRLIFAPRRGLVHGPSYEILVLPVVPDSPAHPVMVGVVDSEGRIVCRGIDDLAEALPDPFGSGPRNVLAALEKILEIASDLVPEAEAAAESDQPRGMGLRVTEVPGQAVQVIGY